MNKQFDLREEAKNHLLIAAHRGVYGGNIPCNTLDAFRAALFQKADMIELDVGKSRDGTLYVFHEGLEKVQLNCDRPLGSMTDAEIKTLRYVNLDRTPTANGINLLDEAFEFLKGKCYINVDKFALYPADIMRTVKRHGLMQQVVVKSPAEKMRLDAIEELAPEIPYIVIIKEEDRVTEEIFHRNINFIGIETVFSSEESPVAQDGYRERMHRRGLLLWGNGIVYNYKHVLSAGHSDDVSITGKPEAGWGWLARKGFDILQTDWPLQIRMYLEENNLYFKEKG
ncbi:MAG: glycerophosphodiester phosphodiesterase family protein [Clostridia bacterium]|nr:glycerophosphodiester phosphodiesterase family protein [Clostridia bacterium]